MKDYHVHYYLDSCAADEMTFANIENKCKELDIDEISVLKHYSTGMPNGKKDWICWHCVDNTAWDRYLAEYSAYKPQHIKIHSGVETELCNQRGDINIPDNEAAKIDMCALSLHYMPTLDCLPMDLLIYPVLSFNPDYNNAEGARLVSEWHDKTVAAGEENIISAVAEGYRNAILRHDKVKTLAHMSDGLAQLITYKVDVDKVGEKKATEIFEPLMVTMADKNILWELNSGDVHFPLILKRANELGVKFCATADGHQLDSGWGPLKNHIAAEHLLDRYNLNRGTIIFGEK